MIHWLARSVSRLFRTKRAILLSVLILVGIVLFFSRERWLLAVGDFLVHQDRLHPAEVIHVIAGEDYRTDYAINLYKRGMAKILLFTGGWCKFHNYHHGQHAEERCLQQAVPPEAIAYDDSSVISTYMEAQRLKDWISGRPTPARSVIVVSDPFHKRRARWTYKRLLGDGTEIQMAPVPFEHTSYKRRWWTDRASKLFVQEEYKKYFYYLLRYQISRGRFRTWLASNDRD